MEISIGERGGVAMEVLYTECVHRKSDAQSLSVTSNKCILAAKALAPLSRLQ